MKMESLIWEKKMKSNGERGSETGVACKGRRKIARRQRESSKEWEQAGENFMRENWTAKYKESKISKRAHMYGSNGQFKAAEGMEEN